MISYCVARVGIGNFLIWSSYVNIFKIFVCIGISQWIDIYRWSDSPDDGDTGSLRVLHFHRPLALSVNPTLQEHPSFQRVRSTTGQRVKVNSRSTGEGQLQVNGWRSLKNSRSLKEKQFMFQEWRLLQNLSYGYVLTN